MNKVLFKVESKFLVKLLRELEFVKIAHQTPKTLEGREVYKKIVEIVEK